MITSPGNARMKAVMQMKQKAKVRRETDAFLAEGIKMFLEAPTERIREVYISESFSCPDKKLEAAVTKRLDTPALPSRHRSNSRAGVQSKWWT